MGLFGNKRPKLRSYVGVDLDTLLQDPEWSYALGEAGIDPAQCEVILRLAECTVGSGGAPDNAAPAVLFGQGNILAVAFPGEREIQVAKRDTSRADLQTQRSGWFQIMFGPASSLNGFMFWGHEDNLKLDTPEGEKFGNVMSAFLKGQLKPQQIVGTPQGLVSSGVTVEPPAPAFDDPEDVTRWKMVYSVHSSLAEMMAKYKLCWDQAEHVEKAFAMANAEFVDGVRQHEISREHFRSHGVQAEGELEALLVDLRESTSLAKTKWQDLVFLLPGNAENDVEKIGDWCTSHQVAPEVMGSILGTGMLIYSDFGTTRESFRAENQRVTEIMKRSRQ